MLFSNPELAKWINDNFEPTWQSVRPVPRITIDFGNGTTINRTLHGNIASWVCDSDGNSIDVLPGIYDPETYRIQLEELVELHGAIGQLSNDKQIAAALNQYHTFKTKFSGKQESKRSQSAYASVTNVSLLDSDTQLNERARRLEIHQQFQNAGLFAPLEMTNWLYREVLNADLEDPYLGLHKTLFDSYPVDFEDEEKNSHPINSN